MIRVSLKLFLARASSKSHLKFIKLKNQINSNREVTLLLSMGANPNRLFTEHGGISPFHITVGLDQDVKFTLLKTRRYF